MPTLRELEATFVRYDERLTRLTEVVGDPLTWKPGDPTVDVDRMVEHTLHEDADGAPFPLAQAQGLRMLCPGAGCKHRINVSFADRGVPDHLGSHAREGVPSRWVVAAGSGLDDLTLQPSVDVGTPSCWHGYVTAGRAA